MDQLSIDDYKQTISNEIIRLKTHLSDIETLFENKFYIGAPPGFESNDRDTIERKCLAWCYDNEIPCKVIVINPTDSLKKGMIASWRVFEFKNKADMVAFKFRWNNCTRA